MLYSSAYWKNYKDNGKPLNYNDSNKNNQGMLIDLTTPKIEWGNGNFSVNENGYLVAKGGGSIAGFKIGDTTLIGGSGTSTVGMCSKSGDEWAFWAGASQGANAPFHVGHGGELYSTSGNIGGWTINGTELLSNNGNTHISSSGALRGPNWSITSGGYATFADVKITNGASSQSATTKLLDFGSFYVRKDGYMSASNGNISGNLVSSGINASNITSGRLNISDGSGHYLRMGFGEGDNPSVSGLNVGGYGLFANSGIRATSFTVQEGQYQYSGMDLTGLTIRTGTKAVQLSFRKGLLYAYNELE